MTTSQKRRHPQHNPQKAPSSTPGLQPRNSNKRRRMTPTIQAPAHPSLQPLFRTVPPEFRSHPLGSFINIRQWTYSNSDSEEEGPQQKQQGQGEQRRRQRRRCRRRQLKRERQQMTCIEACNAGRSLQQVVSSRSKSTGDDDAGSNPTKLSTDLQAVLKRVNSLQPPSDSDWDSDPEEQHPIIRFQTWEKRKTKKRQAEKKALDNSILSAGWRERKIITSISKEEEKILVLKKDGTPSRVAINTIRDHQDPSSSAETLMAGSNDISEGLASSIEAVMIIDAPSSVDEASPSSVLTATNSLSAPSATTLARTGANDPSSATSSYFPSSSSLTPPSTPSPTVHTSEEIRQHIKKMTRTPLTHRQQQHQQPAYPRQPFSRIAAPPQPTVVNSTLQPPATPLTSSKPPTPTMTSTIAAPLSKGTKSTSNSPPSSSRRSSRKIPVISDATRALTTGCRLERESTCCKEGPAAVPMVQGRGELRLAKSGSRLDQNEEDSMQCVDIASADVEDHLAIENREPQNSSVKSRERSSIPIPIERSLGLLSGAKSRPNKGNIAIEGPRCVKKRSRSLKSACNSQVSDMDLDMDTGMKDVERIIVIRQAEPLSKVGLCQGMIRIEDVEASGQPDAEVAANVADTTNENMADTLPDREGSIGPTSTLLMRESEHPHLRDDTEDMDLLIRAVDMHYIKTLPLVRDHPNYMEWMIETIFSKYMQATSPLFEGDQGLIKGDTLVEDMSVVQGDVSNVDWRWVSNKIRILVREIGRAYSPIKEADDDDIGSLCTAEKCSSCGGSGIQRCLKFGTIPIQCSGTRGM
ncbi:hypothetical protein BGZ51_005253 [Haplosporangium sp. Z 767]|nr:hypothetical protein BGZ50_006061 [Haplosporangium sp. Z 11]KAF9181698.1 hypothetical protein BGZ51_005253 [Haplosporangium sp. Z 767]